jgi:hypothetical protein
LQRVHGRGASPSKSSIRVRSSHSPHHGGLDRWPACVGNYHSFSGVPRDIGWRPPYAVAEDRNRFIVDDGGEMWTGGRCTRWPRMGARQFCR